MAVVSKGNKGGYSTLLFTSTGSANTAQVNVAGETVTSMKLSSVLWSANSGETWTITRGGNTIATLYNSGDWDLQSKAIQLEQGGDASANLDVTLSGGTGTCVLKLHKASNFTTEY